MPVIPQYQQRISPSGQVNLGRATPNPMGQGLAELGQAVVGVFDKRAEEEAKEYIGKAVSDTQLKWREEMLNRQSQAEEGAPNFTKNFLTDFDDYANKTIEAAPNETTKQALRESFQEYRTRLGSSAIEFESSARVKKRYNSAVTSIDNWAAGIASAPTEENISEALSVIDTTLPDVGPENRKRLKDYARSQITKSAWASRIEREPEAVKLEIDRVFGKKQPEPLEAKDAIEYVIGIEGGFVADDAGAGPTKFGINQEANPDIDVKSLTKEKAEQIYQKRYWDKIGADKLPPDVALYAYDTAVNMGVSFAKQMLADGGGDVAEMARIRKERYEEIALANPEKAQYLKGWINRADKVKNEALSKMVGDVNSNEKITQSSGLVRMTPVDELILYKSKAETELRQRQSVALNSLRQHITDAAAMAKQGIVDPDPLSSESFRLMGDKAADAYLQYNKTQRLARNVNKLSSSTNADLEAIVGGALATASPGEGYAADTAIDNALKEAAMNVLKQRDDDPGGFVARNVPSVKQAYDRVEEQGLLQAVNESIAAQEALEIDNPRVLTAAQVQSYGDRIMNATTPEDVSDFVASIEEDFTEKYFRQAMGELMQADKLPPALLVIPDLPTAGARDLVAATAFAKMDQLKAGVDKGDITTMNDQIQGKMAELVQTIPVVEMGAVSVVQAYEETAQKLALQMMQRGVSANDAVERSVNMLWGHYELDGTIRKPKTARFDVEGRAGLLLDEQADTFDVPFDLMQSRTDKEARQEWADLIRNHRKFFTNPEGTGVQVWAQGMDGVLYRVTKDGQQVEYGFDELQSFLSVGELNQKAAGQTLEQSRGISEFRTRPTTGGYINR